MKTRIPILGWDDRFAVGLDEIDAQHRRIFEIAGHLANLPLNGVAPEQLESILGELEQYAAEHFPTEEALMHRYPVSSAHVKSHLRAHQEFVLYLQRTNRLAANTPDVAASLLVFLAQWLLHHVVNMDRLMAAEVLALQSGQAPGKVTTPAVAPNDFLMECLSAAYRDLGERTFQVIETNLQLQAEIDRRKLVEQELLENKARFRTVADHTHSWEYWQGPSGNIIYMSPSCERITGYKVAAFIEDPDLLYRIIHPQDNQVMQDHRYSVTFEDHGDDDAELGFRIISADGEVRWIQHTCKALYDQDGNFLGRRASNRDITDRRAQGGDTMLLVATVFDAVNEAVVLTDEDNCVVMANSSFASITGYAPEEMIGKDPGMLEESPQEPEYALKLWQTMTASGRWQGEKIFRKKTGELYCAAVSIDSVRDENGFITNFVLVFSDISERKEHERRIHYLANYDQLTGLPNWTLFNDRMHQAVANAKRNGSQLALLFVDIDRFKAAKDQVGHEASDMLIREVARRVLDSLREADTAARIGSDEFVVLLPGIESGNEAMGTAERVLQAFGAPFELGGRTIQVTASIGVAFYPVHAQDGDQLMRNADLAAYQAKQAGGALVMAYNDPAEWLERLRTGKSFG